MPEKIPPSQKAFIDLSGRGGLAPRWYGDEGDTISQYPQYRYLGADGQMAAGVWNSTRRFGYMAPSPNSYTTVTLSSGGQTFTNEFRATVYDAANGYAYLAENGPNIWVNQAGSAPTDFQTFSAGNIGSPISGSNVAVTDLEIYQKNGTRSIFYTYQKTSGSGGDIGIATASTATTTSNTYLSSVATGGFNLGATNDHFMVVSDNGFMYIGDGNAVHKLDGTALTGGTDGRATQNVLITPPSFTFVDGVDWKGRLWLAVVDSPVVYNNATSFSGNFAGVYVWDRQTTIANVEDFIPLKGVRAIKKIYITQSGAVRVLCMSSKRTLQIREYNGSVFETISEGHLVSYPIYRDCFAVAGNQVNWAGGDGRLYAHGDILGGTPPNGLGQEMLNDTEQLYIIGDITTLNTLAPFYPGAILYLDNNGSTTVTRTSLILSMRDSTPSVRARAWYPNGTVATPFAGNVFTLVKTFPVPSKVNYVRIYHNPGATSGSTQQGTLSVYLNQATSATKTFAITRDDIAKGWKYCPVNQGAKNAVYAIQFQIQWSSVLTADATDWLPRALEIDYTPLEKLL